MTLRQRLRRMALILLAVYAALFVLCFVWEYQSGARYTRETARGDGSMRSVAVGKKNYASAQYQYRAPGGAAQVDQKYEKTATVQSQTKRFREDEAGAREAIAQYNGIIQYESGRGVTGRRVLFLHIGIQPASFDAFYADIQKIGTVLATEISKTDKTNEFLALKAKRSSLEKTRAALVDLKKHDGRIDELMALERQILDIEQQLQSLGVQLGEFDEVNAFCTVRFSLAEYAERVYSRSFLSIAKGALMTSTAIFAGLLALLFGVGVTALVLLLVAERFNLVRKIAAGLDRQPGEGGGDGKA